MPLKIICAVNIDEIINNDLKILQQIVQKENNNVLLIKYEIL